MSLKKNKSKKSVAARQFVETHAPRVAQTQYYRPQHTIRRSLGPKSVQDAASTPSTNARRQQETAKKSKSWVTRVVKNTINLIIIASFLIAGFAATTMSTHVEVSLTEGSFSYRDESEYTEAAQKSLQQTITRTSKLLFRSAEYEQEILQIFPELTSAHAVLPLAGRQLSLKLRVAQPLATLSFNNEQFILTQNGVAVASARNSAVPLPILTVTGLDTIRNGDRLITSNEAALLDKVSRELANTTLTTSKLGAITAIDFNVADGLWTFRFKDTPYAVKVTSYADLNEQIGGAKATLTSLDREGTLPSQYLDARVVGRVFVK